MPDRKLDELDALLDQQGQSVWRLVVRILGNDGADAVDCFQQAFVELVQRLRRPSGVRHAGALLKRIAAGRAIDVVRKRIRERGRNSEVDGALVASPRSFEPDAQAEANEFLDGLRAALVELPEAQSAAFVLTQIEEISNEDAAAAIGVTVNHVGVLLHRAKAVLRERLESHNPIRNPGNESSTSR
jgi:RNA polymerase sigma-70 factor (ECF subfamily)